LKQTWRIAAALTLTSALLFGCSREVPIEITFAPTVGGEPVSCQAATHGFALNDLRFYVHDVALINAGDSPTPVKLTADGTWQTERVALLDFENGSDNCAEGTAGTHTAIVGRAPLADYVGMRFKLGIPFELNHASPAEADPPLNLGRLHWGWQAGYKFLRFEGTVRDYAVRFHLGSTGCEGTIGNIKSCGRPNRAEIEISGFSLGQTVDIDIAALVSAAAKRNSTVSCMSEPDDPNCSRLFQLVGIDPASGKPLPAQELFRMRPS
jgi:uncharacterized repeat protein (TIGR04052 family)